MTRRLITPTIACCAVLLCVEAAHGQPYGQPCNAEPTDQLLSYGAHIHPCEIGVLGDSDLFRFEGTAGETIVVTAVDQAAGFSIPSCALELFRPDGTLVTAIGNDTTCEIRTTLDAGGLFTARVTESGNNHLMTYSLQLHRLIPSTSEARSINPGDTLSGMIIDPRGTRTGTYSTV